MLICKIFNSNKEQIRDFKTDETQLGNSISVGKSQKCLISLPESNGIEEMHFAIVKKENLWRLENPGNDVALINGKRIDDIELADSMVVVFGSCFMKVEKEKKRSNFDLIWESQKENSIERAPLYEDTNSVGSAEYCDIIIKSDDCGSEHLNVIVKDMAFMLEDLKSGFSTTYLGKELKQSTAIELNRKFFIGSIPLKIVSKDTPEVNISFKTEKINWPLFNIILMFIAFILIILIGWNRLTTKSTEHETVKQNFNSGTEKILIANIKTSIEKGNPSYGIDDIAELLKQGKSKEEYQQLEKALGIELRAVENMRFYQLKTEEVIEKNITYSYINFLFSSDDIEDQLNHEITYWNNVINKLQGFKLKITQKALKSFNTIGTKSYFLDNYDVLTGEINIIQTEFNDYLKLYLAWKNEDWPTAIKLLGVIKSSNKKVNEEKFEQYLSDTISTAEFAWQLQKKSDAFSNADFLTYNLKNLQNDLKNDSESLEKQSKTFPMDDLKGKLSLLEISNEQLIQLKPIFKDWQNEPDNIDKFRKLAQSVENESFSNSKFKIMSDAYRLTNRKMRNYISDSVEKIQTDSNRDSLKECNKLESFLVIQGTFGTGIQSQNLNEKRKKIELAIREKCNDLYNQYQSAASKGDPKNIKTVLTKILQTAPEKSHYYKWAEKSLRNL